MDSPLLSAAFISGNNFFYVLSTQCIILQSLPYLLLCILFPPGRKL
ncbi:hypothetical protein TPE_1393 [Treponema pedis str. T A4]|uniref:Uncharacterized protein n=1 Tax=Treponema pedis str. T A4 TaxID=1291379 RepID=S5ZZV1_9SPIR|nr:hypothetical protein TPE_1393 [Treponema pedis str. T A4]